MSHPWPFGHASGIHSLNMNAACHTNQTPVRTTPRPRAGHNSYMEDYLKRKHRNLLLKITGTIIMCFGWWTLTAVTDHAWQQALIGFLFIFGAATVASGMEN